MTDNTTPPRRKRSLIELLTSLPDQVAELVRREIALITTEITAKLKALGTGVGLLVGAALVLLLFVGVLLVLAIIGLSVLVEPWAAALIVAGILLVIAIVLALVGRQIIMRNMPPLPTESIQSIQKDVAAVTGRGKRGTR